MRYYVIFSKQGKPVMGVWVEAKNKEEATTNGEFKAICHVRNILYDDCHVVGHENE